MHADARLVDGMGHVVHAGLECMPHVEYRLICLAGALGEMVPIHRMAVPVALLTTPDAWIRDAARELFRHRYGVTEPVRKIRTQVKEVREVRDVMKASAFFTSLASFTPDHITFIDLFLPASSVTYGPASQVHHRSERLVDADLHVHTR